MEPNTRAQRVQNNLQEASSAAMLVAAGGGGASSGGGAAGEAGRGRAGRQLSHQVAVTGASDSGRPLNGRLQRRNSAGVPQPLQLQH